MIASQSLATTTYVLYSLSGYTPVYQKVSPSLQVPRSKTIRIRHRVCLFHVSILHNLDELVVNTELIRVVPLGGGHWLLESAIKAFAL
jgi:hypothetical protein